MHKYIPHTREEKEEMLKSIGRSSVDELFTDIPENLRLGRDLELDNAKSEQEVRSILGGLSQMNQPTDQLTCFLGAGAYDHYIPSIVKQLASRSEYYTSYTPYQPEISQGTLQVIFEFQSMIAALTDMDVANASMYDAGTACAEAAIMTADKKKTILVSEGVNPNTKAVLKTYLKMRGLTYKEIGLTEGRTCLNSLKENLDKDVASVVIQSPNFFGYLDRSEDIEKQVHANKSALIMSVDPISMGLFKSPGKIGADIVVGDGQSLGNSLNFGGPYLGFLAATNKYLRKMPGRICGETVDKNGEKAYVLTLQAREQHIRRAKATSNICSNQGLAAVMATIYMSVMGKQGLREVAEQCFAKASYAYKQIEERGIGKLKYDGPFFKEFPIEFKKDAKEINKALLEKGILGGYALGQDFKDMANTMVLCVTEKRTKEEIDRLINELEVICK